MQSQQGRGGAGLGSSGKTAPQILIGFTVKGIASGIGLISESIHARREAKLQKKERESTTLTNPRESSSMPSSSVETQIESHESEVAAKNHSGYEPRGDSDHLEEEWELDDAQDDILSSYTGTAQSADRTTAIAASSTALEITNRFLMDMPSHHYTSNSQTRLQYPVVLPQRRPKDRSRGFIRAYAPVLEPCGINQAEWLAFLDTFQKVRPIHGSRLSTSLPLLPQPCQCQNRFR